LFSLLFVVISSAFASDLDCRMCKK